MVMVTMKSDVLWVHIGYSSTLFWNQWNQWKSELKTALISSKTTERSGRPMTNRQCGCLCRICETEATLWCDREEIDGHAVNSYHMIRRIEYIDDFNKFILLIYIR